MKRRTRWHETCNIQCMTNQNLKLATVTLMILTATVAHAEVKATIKQVKSIRTIVKATYDFEDLPGLMESCVGLKEGDKLTRCLNNASDELKEEIEMQNFENEGEES